MKSILKVAIANRGEVACRIHKTCKKMGLKTVLLHSDADIKTKAYRICDETINIGPGPTLESYLNIDAQIKAALETGADAIHPGFGFLSENAEFAKRVINAGLIFIGPSPEIIESFGDKIKAKSLCKLANVPMVPGYQNQSASLETLVEQCDTIGYPVLVKAAAGGGGRGMRLIKDRSSAESEIKSAMNEATKAFGNGTVFLEKYLDHAKHIEVQIFGDAEGKIHVLGERECSVQRRHQKIIEETPSPSINSQQREELFNYARRIGEVGHYQNAGTVEFMFQDNQFYFLEVNTRLQVEHTVTEEVLNIDLVEAQIMTAMGKSIQLPKTFNPNLHSIELRLYAEDPYQNGVPSTGQVGSIYLPLGFGRRLEIGIDPNDEITPYYDSMIGKMISTQKSRIESITDLISWINESTVFGVQTNRPLLKKILNQPEFIVGTMNTKFFEKYFSTSLNQELKNDELHKLEKILIKNLQTTPSNVNTNHGSAQDNELTNSICGNLISSSNKTLSPWSQRWRNPDLYSSNTFDLSDIKFEQVGYNLWFKKGDDTYKVGLKNDKKSNLSHTNGLIKAPMPGSVFKVLCSVGQVVEIGQNLIILEAMKMEHSLKSDHKGKISKVNFKPGETVNDGDILIELEFIN